MPRCDYLQLAFHHNRPSPRPASLTPLQRLFCSLYSRCLAFSKNKPGIPHPGHEPPQTNVGPISPQPLLLRNKLDPQLSNRRMTTHARTNERTNERTPVLPMPLSFHSLLFLLPWSIFVRTRYALPRPSPPTPTTTSSNHNEREPFHPTTRATDLSATRDKAATKEKK